MSQVLGIRFGCNSSETFDEESKQTSQEHEATYVVEMDTETQRENDVAGVSGVPWVGMPSPILSGGFCAGRTMTEVGPKIWEVTASFKTSSKSKPSDEPPWQTQPSWSWGFEVVELPIHEDAMEFDKPIHNSAGERFPTVTSPVALPVLTITRVEVSFSPDIIMDYVNYVNSAPFWGADTIQALMTGISASPQVIKDLDVWNVTYVIKFNLHPNWLLRLLDFGHYSLGAPDDDGVYQKVPFGDAANQQILGNLDGHGNKLGQDDSPVFMEFNRYPFTDFNDLNLGPW